MRTRVGQVRHGLHRTDVASEAIERTRARAQRMVAELMDDEAAPVAPGSLRRAAAAPGAGLS